MSHALFCLALYQRCIHKYMYISIATFKYLPFCHLAECFNIRLHWKQSLSNHSISFPKRIDTFLTSRYILYKGITVHEDISHSFRNSQGILYLKVYCGLYINQQKGTYFRQLRVQFESFKKKKQNSELIIMTILSLRFPPHQLF